MGCEISKLCSSEKRQPVLSASDSPAAEQADLEMSTAGASHCAAVTYTAAPGATKVVVTAPESLETPDGSGHLQQVKFILQELAVVPVDGSRASVRQAATVLLKHLQSAGADTVILSACAPGSNVVIHAGMAGIGSPGQQQPLSIDSTISAAACNLQITPFLYQAVTSDDAAKDLPPDWSALRREHGLQTFLAMQVGLEGNAVGVMTLASRRQAAFQEPWWESVLSMIATSSNLVVLLGHPLMAGLCELGAQLHLKGTCDYKAYIFTLLQRSAALLEKVAPSKLVVRLGLLSRDKQTLIVQHVAPSGDRTGAAPAVRQVRMAAQGTIFAEALEAKTPRLIADTSFHEEELNESAGDMLLDGATAGSLIVVPLQQEEDAPYQAAMYFVHDKPGDFSEVKRAISNLTSMLQMVLQEQLKDGGLLTQVWADSRAKRESAACSTAAAGSSTAGRVSLVQMMQQRVREAVAVAAFKRAQVQRNNYVEELSLQRTLGKGGFGVVYLGTWQGYPAAIKVMPVPKQERRVVKGAMEMAVQETLSHPNIVRVYACLTDMVEELVTEHTSYEYGDPVHNPRKLRYRPAEADDMERQSLCNLMIMEYCDMGTLSAAVRVRGLVHSMSPQRTLTVSMWRLLMVLLDVARSLEYIHSMKLLHCDLKPDNVLLSSCSSAPLGLTAKLADFGLVKMLFNDSMYIRNKSASGTITHLAPERFHPDSKLTSAVDMFAFGMLMFELYTRQRPFASMPAAAIVQQVTRANRPEFPTGTPGGYKQLAEACWAQEPEQRPTASEVVRRLHEMIALTDGPTPSAFQQSIKSE